MKNNKPETTHSLKALIIGLLFLSFNHLSCQKKCVVCAVENKSGKLTSVSSECERSARFLQGWEDGLKLYYKEHGDTNTVQCLPAK